MNVKSSPAFFPGEPLQDKMTTSVVSVYVCVRMCVRVCVYRLPKMKVYCGLRKILRTGKGEHLPLSPSADIEGNKFVAEKTPPAEGVSFWGSRVLSGCTC